MDSGVETTIWNWANASFDRANATFDGENTTFENAIFENATFGNATFENATFDWRNSTFVWGNETENSTQTCVPPAYPEGRYAVATKMLWLVFAPIVILAGIAGNLLTLAVILRQRASSSSMGVFLSALAVSDIIFILNSPLRNWILNGLEKTDVRTISELGCKFSVFFTYSSAQFSSWILVAVTCERLVSVVLPHRVKLGCTTRAARVVIAAIFGTLVLLNGHIFYGHGQSTIPYLDGSCEAIDVDYNNFWTKVWPWIDFAVTFAVPSIILIISNAVIIYKVRESAMKRRLLSIKHKTSGSEGSQRGVTAILITLTVAFFICLTPVQVYFIYFPYSLDDALEKYFCVDWPAFAVFVDRHFFLNAIVNILSYINATCNFFLYVLSGTRFRREVVALLLCKPHGDAVFGTSKSTTRRQHTYVTDTINTISSGEKHD